MLKKQLQQLSTRINFGVLGLIVGGSITWSLTMIKSGLKYPFGIGFWGANGHDGIWHISLARALSRENVQMPIFSGTEIKNYHIVFDLLLGWLSKVTNISVTTLYFQILPPILAIFIGIAVYGFVKTWKGKKEAIWSVFFVYFGGSFGWVVTLLKEGAIGGESMFWSQQAISTLINPPFALSLFLIFAGLIYLTKLNNPQAINVKFPKFFNNKIFVYSGCILIFGILIQVKVYAGLLVLFGLLSAAVFDYLKRRRSALFVVFVLTLIFSGLIFLPNLGSSSLVTFKPFWFLQSLVGLTDRFYWPRMESAIINYQLAGNYFKLIGAYLVVFGIFIIGNLSTRLISFVYAAKHKNKLIYLDAFIYTVIIAGIVVPMLFLQVGTPWNTIQFFYYSLVFLGVLAGIAVANAHKYLQILIILLTMPTTMATLKDVYLPSRPPAKISLQEMDALAFLEGQSEGGVLTYPYDEYKAKAEENNPPRSLYVYTSTAYVSAYANKPVYLEDEINLDITGYDWRKRREEVFSFFAETNSEKAKEFLKNNNIKYLYLVRKLSPSVGELMKVGPGQLGLEQVYENQEVVVYRVTL